MSPEALRLWRVKYVAVLVSLSGYGPKTATGYVGTFGSSLEDVEDAIRSSLDCNTFRELISAEWIGDTLNDLEGSGSFIAGYKSGIAALDKRAEVTRA